MLLVKILLGFLGLGIVVLVHEIGHFIAARAVGIDVEAFSIGWGKVLLKKKVGAVEYRLSLFPLGGYCKMKGDSDLKRGSDADFAPEKGSFYAAAPWRRIIVAAAGPAFNVLFAVVVFSVIWGIGFESAASDNRIVLASEYIEGTFAADKAGLETGDRVIAINGDKIEKFSDIQQKVALNPDKTLVFTIERGGRTLNIEVTPSFNKEDGVGKVGVYPWIDPVIGEVAAGSAAEAAGLQKGDVITKLEGREVAHSVDFSNTLAKYEDKDALNIEWTRERSHHEGVVVNAAEGYGIKWQLPMFKTPQYSLLGAVHKGVSEALFTIEAQVKGLSFLFRGVNLAKSVSGPVRITYMIGESASVGFQESAGTGLRYAAEFLALISVALGIMNLLPIPILDGGLILLFIVETIRARPVPQKAVAAFQMIGFALIGSLMVLALFGDIVFFAKK